MRYKYLVILVILTFFSISTDALVGATEMQDFSYGLTGAILQPTDNLMGYIPFGLYDITPPGAEMPLPDIDLHAYTPDGKHIGVNYTTHVFEQEIPGAHSSGDLLNGGEWIFVPGNIKVFFTVDSRENQIFLNSYPQLQKVTNGTQSYNIDIIYDAPDGIRYTESIIQSIQPGIIMKYHNAIAKNTNGTYSFIRDDTPPIIFNMTPENVTSAQEISAEFIDNPGGSGIDSSSISLIVDGIDVTYNAEITDSSISNNLLLKDGPHNATLYVSDNAANRAMANWNFTLKTAPTTVTHKAPGISFLTSFASFFILLFLKKFKIIFIQL